MAELYIAEVNEYTVGRGAVPDPRIRERPETDLIKVWLHVEKQTAAGHEIDRQNVIRER